MDVYDEKGASTGAIARRTGRFELADKGSLFLDEIGDFPPDLQPKLLRVPQEKEFERVGGKEALLNAIRAALEGPGKI
jgi:transcriptional regulator with GAF, ATPase, and Fis domain